MTNHARKDRLDKLVVERGLAPTRAKAQAYIMAGEVRVNGQVATKSGVKISADSDITLANVMPYASRGGYKLAGAVEKFGVDLTDRICADVGACTGGFTDVMLQAGARRVYAIDVGYGQLDWKLRQDNRVVVMERTNARYVEALEETISFASIDVSFISLQLILPAVKKWSAEPFEIVALIKPQFEAGKQQVGRGGIVKDVAVHRQVLERIVGFSAENQLYPAGLVQSSIQGADGNVEFLIHLKSDSTPSFDAAAIIAELTPSEEE